MTFRARDKIDSQTHDNATFDRSLISNAVFKKASEKCLVDGIECKHDRNNYREAYQEIENFYRLKRETNLLMAFFDLHKFTTNCNFYVFDLSKQKDHIASQPIILEFKLGSAIDVADYIAYALVLTPML